VEREKKENQRGLLLLAEKKKKELSFDCEEKKKEGLISISSGKKGGGVIQSAPDLNQRKRKRGGGGRPYYFLVRGKEVLLPEPREGGEKGGFGIFGEREGHRGSACVLLFHQERKTRLRKRSNISLPVPGEARPIIT